MFDQDNPNLPLASLTDEPIYLINNQSTCIVRLRHFKDCYVVSVIRTDDDEETRQNSFERFKNSPTAALAYLTNTNFVKTDWRKWEFMLELYRERVLKIR